MEQALPFQVDVHIDNGDIVVRDDDGRIVANCQCDARTFGELSIEDIKENALLFSAAPEMRAGLEEIRRMYEMSPFRNMPWITAICDKALHKFGSSLNIVADPASNDSTHTTAGETHNESSHGTL